MAAKSPPAGLRRLSLRTAHTCGCGIPAAQGRGKGSSHQSSGTCGDTAVGTLRVHAGPCPGVLGNRRGLPGGLHTTLFPSPCVGASSEGRKWLGKTAPVLLGSAGRQRFSPSCRGLPFAFFTLSRRRNVFPYFIQWSHVNCKPRFYRGSLI